MRIFKESVNYYLALINPNYKHFQQTFNKSFNFLYCFTLWPHAQCPTQVLLSPATLQHVHSSYCTSWHLNDKLLLARAKKHERGQDKSLSQGRKRGTYTTGVWRRTAPHGQLLSSSHKPCYHNLAVGNIALVYTPAARSTDNEDSKHSAWNHTIFLVGDDQ